MKTRLPQPLTDLGAPSLFGLAPGGACHACPVASAAVRSYRTFSPLPRKRGGIFSVALSLNAPKWARWPGVTRRLVSMEPGLSSVSISSTRPSDRLAWEMWLLRPERSSRGGFHRPDFRPAPALKAPIGHTHGKASPVFRTIDAPHAGRRRVRKVWRSEHRQPSHESVVAMVNLKNQIHSCSG